MITVKLSYTYDIVTPESAEDGDVAECGFYQPGGWQFPLPEYGGAPLDESPEPEEMTARQALREIRDNVGYIDHVQEHGDSLDIYPADGSQDYEDGSETRIMAHVRGNPRLIAALARTLNKRR
jgi:hypothetical protein